MPPETNTRTGENPGARDRQRGRDAGREGAARVENQREDTRQRIRNTVPDTSQGGEEAIPSSERFGIGQRMRNVLENATQPISEGWKPLPRPPSLGKTGKALGAAATIAVPPAGIAVAGGLYAGKKAWALADKIPPFSWVTRGAKKLATGAIDGMMNLGGLASYPFELAGRLGANVLRVSARAGYRILDVTVLELIRDVEKAINTKLEYPEGTNIAAQALIGLKKSLSMLIDLPLQITQNVVGKVVEHPVASILAFALGAGALASADWSVVGAAQNIYNGIIQFFTSIMQAIK